MLKIALIIYLNISWIMAIDVTSRETLETYFEWKIRKFFDVSTVNDHYLDSPVFSLGNAKWFLTIYPNGTTELDSRGYISMYIETLNPEEEYYVGFTLGLKKPSGSEILSYKTEHMFVQSSKSWGWSLFMQRSTLYSMDDSVSSEGTLTVFCTARILNDSEALLANTPSKGIGNLSDNFKDLYTSKLFSDIKLVVTSTEFSAHKNVLSCRLPHFRSMGENIPSRVEINDVDSGSFEEFLLFVYTGKLSKLSSYKAMSLYKTANKYDLPELKEACAQSIAANDLNVNSFYDILGFANMHNDNVLLTAVTEFLIKHAKSILSTEEWEKFLKNDPLKVNKLFLRYAQNKK